MTYMIIITINITRGEASYTSFFYHNQNTNKMNLDFQKLSGWELTKAIYLVQQAKELGMSLNGYGQIDVNPNSEYTYLWSEDYPFTLYMPIDCRLNPNDVYVLYSDSMNGEEVEESLSNFSSLEEIYEWVEKLENA